MRRTDPGRPGRALAFTLVEVAASVAILGGVIAGLLIARGRSLRTHQAARELMTCRQLCAARVAAVRAGVQPSGQGIMDYPEGYRWSVTAPELPEDAPERLCAYRVTVRAPAWGRAEVPSVSATVWMLPTQTNGEGTP